PLAVVLFASSHSPGAPRHLLSFPTRRSSDLRGAASLAGHRGRRRLRPDRLARRRARRGPRVPGGGARSERGGGGRPGGRSRARRSEEHTSELQSRENLVCRLLLEKKKRNQKR